IESVKYKWREREKSVNEQYEKILRELQKSKIDGEEFIQLQRSIETLRPLRDQLEDLRRAENELLQERRNALAEWEDIKRQEFQSLERAAKQVSRKLRNRVRVTVT